MANDQLDSQAAAMAALSLCESLALALAEEGVLDREEVRGVCMDAMDVHRTAVVSGPRPDVHLRAAELIGRIIDSLERLPAERRQLQRH